ncbi:glycine cleavage system regulatory protein [Haloferula luteola]|uniref:Glycine cleavage system regulatory protein n=1 Tax=Haloferula luteola TaxID=595692 RepID=A0A840V2C6_9BACT|nr:ACT domain-containing protein [Haloferula luteola]MBB5351613.1 glycine cleavage system regulatory protein [Haloferula luteola]
MTVLAPDRTGIVKSISETIAAHGGNWLESRMARLAGQFAGIVRVECSEAEVEGLMADLEALEGLAIQTRRESLAGEEHHDFIHLDVVGNDRPGIVRQLSAAIASVGANLEDLHTQLESAPMAGHPLFHATVTVSLPPDVSPGALTQSIETLGEDLAVTVLD